MRLVKKGIWCLVLLCFTLSATGCIAAWVAGGVVVGAAIGYAVSEDMQDGKFIDSEEWEK